MKPCAALYNLCTFFFALFAPFRGYFYFGLNLCAFVPLREFILRFLPYPPKITPPPPWSYQINYSYRLEAPYRPQIQGFLSRRYPVCTRRASERHLSSYLY